MGHSPYLSCYLGLFYFILFWCRMDVVVFWSEFKNCLEQTSLTMATDDGPIGRYGTIHYMKRLEDVPLVSYPVDDDTVTFGRTDDVVACQIRLYDLWASGRHCQVVFNDGKVSVIFITFWSFGSSIHPGLSPYLRTKRRHRRWHPLYAIKGRAITNHSTTHKWLRVPHLQAPLRLPISTERTTRAASRNTTSQVTQVA